MTDDERWAEEHPGAIDDLIACLYERALLEGRLHEVMVFRDWADLLDYHKFQAIINRELLRGW